MLETAEKSAKKAKPTASERREKRAKAAAMYWAGHTPKEIAKDLNVPESTVYSWRKEDGWELSEPAKRLATRMEMRLHLLVEREDKTELELREIETLSRSLMRAARVQKFFEGGNETDLLPKTKRRHKKKKKEPAKNEFSPEAITEINQAWRDELFDYQNEWWSARRRFRIRNILKSRQIGATWYFAREAFVDAVNTGDNQIFLSASKAQAHIFKLYIRQFAQEVTGVELTGDPIVLWNGATLYFLSTNSATAQGYHGHVYMDEYMWINGFAKLQKVASGMALHKKWKQTYFSTPSSVQHEGYQFWAGEHFNRGRTSAEHVTIDVSHDTLAPGHLGEDNHWRQIVTIHDAMARGCDLFDLEQLRLEYSPETFAQLLECKFSDDLEAVFTLKDLMACMVDGWEVWEDFKPFLDRPLGDRPVWVGYDPSRTRDDACLAVIAPPAVPGGNFRVIEKHRYSNKSFVYQAEQIKRICDRYNVKHIGVDASGIGYGVYERVKEFYPMVEKITYNVAVKTRLVIKAQQLVRTRRLEFDAGEKVTAQAFMGIRKTTLGNGSISYAANRTAETGHADEAWAIMHALDRYEFNDAEGASSESIMELS